MMSPLNDTPDRSDSHHNTEAALPGGVPPVGPFDGACRLHDWGVILATGPDSASFLHGQLTQDMLHLGDSQARLAGYCSAKGRLLATFIAWRAAPEQMALACSADLLAPTLKRLSMFVLRAKCKLSSADGQWALYGLAGLRAEQWLAEAAGTTLPGAPWAVLSFGASRAIRLPAGASTSRLLLVQPADLPAPALPPLARAAWDWLEVQAGVARVVAATVEQFVPQMVNLELTGGVNFQKGCYPGQEVVARSQYRGTLKRRMFLMNAEGPLSPGQEVHHSTDPGQPAGMVALAAPVPGDLSGRHAALVECKSALVGGPGDFTAGAVRLTAGRLPYALPLEPT
jgi:folate-binding protein YgfZ